MLLSVLAFVASLVWCFRLCSPSVISFMTFLCTVLTFAVLPLCAALVFVVLYLFAVPAFVAAFVVPSRFSPFLVLPFRAVCVFVFFPWFAVLAFVVLLCAVLAFVVLPWCACFRLCGPSLVYCFLFMFLSVLVVLLLWSSWGAASAFAVWSFLGMLFLPLWSISCVMFLLCDPCLSFVALPWSVVLWAGRYLARASALQHVWRGQTSKHDPID